MIKAIIFDIGGVIAGDVEEPMFRDISKKQKINFNDVWKVRSKNWNLYGTGKISEDVYWKNMLNKTDIKGTIQYLRKKAYSYLTSTKGIFRIIKKLKKKYRLAIISDNSKEWTQYTVSKYKLKRFFEIMVFSYKVGVLKPNPKIYRYAVKKLKLKFNECLFIDNNQKNLAAARKLGIKTILFKNPSQLNKELKQKGIL